MYSEQIYDQKHPYIPLSMFLFFPSKTDDVYRGEGKMFKRFIFEGDALQNMTEFQKQEEKKLQKYIEQKKHKLPMDALSDPFWNKTQRYRWLLSLRFDTKKTVREMTSYTQYRKTNRFDVTPTAQAYLKAGIIYMSGRDSSYRPIIVFDIEKMLKLKITGQELLEAQKFFLQFVLHNCLLPGQAQTWIAVVDCGYRNIISMLSLVKDCISFLQSTFRCRMRAAYLIKIPPSASIIWAIVKKFIQEETLKRMFIVDGQTVGPLFNSTNASQIEKKYSGKQENITQFWPIRKVNELDSCQYQHEQEESSLISIQKYQQKFKQGKLKGYKICQKLLEEESMTTKNEEFVTEDAIVDSISKQQSQKSEIMDTVAYPAEKYPTQPEDIDLDSTNWFKIQQMMKIL